MYENEPKPPLEAHYMHNQTPAPPLPPRNQKLVKEVPVESIPVASVAPLVQAPSPAKGSIAYTAQLEVREENKIDGGIDKRSDQPPERHPHGFNTKLVGASMSASERVNVWETQTSSNSPSYFRAQLRTPPPSPDILDETTKNPPPIFNSLPQQKSKDLSEKASIASRPPKKLFPLDSTHKTMADQLNKLLSNKGTCYTPKNNFERNLQELKIPERKNAQLVASFPLGLPISTASINVENTCYNVEPSKPATIYEPIYTEIVEEEEKLQLITQTNENRNEVESGTQPSNTELCFDKKQIACVKPFQLGEATNRLPSDESVGITTRRMDKEIDSPELAFIMKDIKEKEIEYIAQLEKALLISKDRVPQETGHKMFGYFQEIHTFHKTQLLFDLDRSKTPKEFVYCFVKHFLRFNFLYIQREWLFSSNFCDADDFENYIIENQNLKPYLSLPKQRLLEYARSLDCFLAICEKNQDRDKRLAAEKTITVIKNLEYQIKMVQQFKKLFEEPDRFKESGEVHLVESFKTKINGSKRKSLLVYLCEEMIIFADTRLKDRYKCIDFIPTSLTCCHVLKNQNQFEIGVKGRNTYNLAAKSQSVKEQWCKKLRTLVKEEL